MLRITPPSTQSNMWEPCRRVADIPELLLPIARELGVRERCKLMRVSKHFFSSIGPMVWRSVPRLDVVLRLVKGTELTFDELESSKGFHHEFTEITITLPASPDLSRYYIYSPWIQELEIFGGCSQQVFYVGPFLKSLCGQPPLPNLRRLTAYTGADDMASKFLMGLIEMFINPSLSDIRTIFHEKGRSAYTHPSSTLNFLKKVQSACPHIQILEFYPGTRFAYNFPDPSPFNGQYHDVLQSFSNLRSFTSTTRVLELETFGVLGNLPHLKSLGIRGSRMDYPVLDERLFAPTFWFKELTDLRLYDLHPQDIEAIWSQSSIVKRLETVLIQTDPTTAPKPLDGSVDGNRWIESFLTALPLLSPHIHDFTFYVGDEDGTRFQISEDVRNGLGSLMLKRVRINLRNTYFSVDENLDAMEYDDEEYYQLG